MRLVPKRRLQKMVWLETRVGPWTENAAAMGSSEEEVAAYAAKVAAARAALTAAERARIAAKNATLALNLAFGTAEVLAAGIVGQVRARAQVSGDPHVYALASIPAPAKGSKLGSPGVPYGFKVQLLQEGAVELTWRCKHPAGSDGVMYHVWRRDTAETEFAYLGVTGAKKFRDETIPLGAAGVMYKLRAVRSTGRGPWATFNVNFGGVGVGRSPSRSTIAA